MYWEQCFPILVIMYVYKYSLNLTFLSASCKYCIKAQDQVQTHTSSTSQEFTGRSRSWVCTLTCPDQTLCTEVYIPTYFNKYRSSSSSLSNPLVVQHCPLWMRHPSLLRSWAFPRELPGAYTSNTSRSCSSSSSRRSSHSSSSIRSSGYISGHSHGQRKSCGRNGTPPGHLLPTSEDTTAVDAYTTTAIPQHTTPAMAVHRSPLLYTAPEHIATVSAHHNSRHTSKLHISSHRYIWSQRQ